MKLVPLTPPILGLNTVNPYVAFDSGYARELTNYFMTGGTLRMRPSVRNIYPSSSAGRIFHHDGEYAIASDGDIYNIDINSTSSNIGGACQKRASTGCKHVSLDLIFGAQEPRNNANPFTAWTFTTDTITDTEIIDGCSFNGRLIVIDADGLEWSDIEQVTGAMEGYSSLARFLDGQSLLRCFTVTAKPGDETQPVLFLFADGGKVLIFAGSYPGSAGWTLIGNYNMTPPIAGGLGFVERDGDIFVAGTQYAYMARDLLNGDALFAYNNRLTKDIENLWQNQYWYQSNLDECPHSFYLDKDITNGISYDLIITQCGQVDYDFGATGRYQNEAQYLVYNRSYKHWSLWMMPPVYAPAIQYSSLTGDVIYGSNTAGGVVSLGFNPIVEDAYYSSGQQTVDIITSWKTPYTSPYQGRYQQLQGIRPYFKNTASGYLDKIRAIYDYSDLNVKYGFYTQPGSTIETNPGKYSDTSLDMAANSYHHYQTYKGMAGKGSSISFQISQKRKSGSADDHAHELYASSAYVTDGGIFV